MSTGTKPATVGETAIDKQWLLSIGGVVEHDSRFDCDWIVFGTHVAMQVKFIVSDDPDDVFPIIYTHGSEAVHMAWTETRDQLRGLFKALETASGFEGLHLR